MKDCLFRILIVFLPCGPGEPRIHHTQIELYLLRPVRILWYRVLDYFSIYLDSLCVCLWFVSILHSRNPPSGFKILVRKTGVQDVRMPEHRARACGESRQITRLPIALFF